MSHRRSSDDRHPQAYRPALTCRRGGQPGDGAPAALDVGAPRRPLSFENGKGLQMTRTVADFLLDRLSAWGVHRIYGYPGDGINGILGALDRAGERSEFDPGPPRGDGGVHGVRARQVHGRGRRVPGDVRAGRDPSAERALRRQARPPAGRRDRRPAGADGDRRRLPAGGRPARRCSRTSRTSTCRWHGPGAGPPPGRSRDADRARPSARVTCVILPNDVQELRRVETPPREHGTLHSGIGVHAAARRADGRRSAARRGVLNAGERVAMLVGAGRAAAPADEVLEVADLLGAGVAKALLGKAVAARRPAVRDRLDRPARARSRAGT